MTPKSPFGESSIKYCIVLYCIVLYCIVLYSSFVLFWLISWVFRMTLFFGICFFLNFFKLSAGLGFWLIIHTYFQSKLWKISYISCEIVKCSSYPKVFLISWSAPHILLIEFEDYFVWGRSSTKILFSLSDLILCSV